VPVTTCLLQVVYECGRLDMGRGLRLEKSVFIMLTLLYCETHAMSVDSSANSGQKVPNLQELQLRFPR
jgi:hypothetical protein